MKEIIEEIMDMLYEDTAINDPYVVDYKYIESQLHEILNRRLREAFQLPIGEE